LTDIVTYDVVKELLLEEFDSGTIESKKDLVLSVMKEVRSRIKFRDRVLDLYRRFNLDIMVDKSGAMRTLSQYFMRSEMRKVYNILSMEMK
jgi:hypothetical protein